MRLNLANNIRDLCGFRKPDELPGHRIAFQGSCDPSLSLSEGSPGRFEPVFYRLAFVFLLLLFAVYSVVAHYVQDYSDPVGFVSRAFAWARGADGADRAPLYPAFLYHCIRLVGRDWVFLANMPFILILLGLVGGLCRLIRPDRVRDSMARPEAMLAPVFAVGILIVVRRGLLLQLVNPYREPLAFSLMLASVWLLWSAWRVPRRTWLAGLGGLALGLATSTRETSLLLVLPIGLWMVTGMVADRKIRWGVMLAFGAGLLLGLLPLLYKNYAYSGQALVPAYSARRVERFAEAGDWDIPVPGMSLSYFPRVAPDTLRRLLSAYRPTGLLLFVAGTWLALKRKQRLVLFLFLPATVMYVLFYGFYNRYLSRYLLAAEVFAVPVMACGAAALLQGLAKFVARLRPGAAAWFRSGVMLGLILWLTARLLPATWQDDGNTKVWHLETLRSTLRSQIEEPAVFLGHRHFSFRMRWLLDQASYEYTRRFQFDRTPYSSLEDRLRQQGLATVKRFAQGNYYINESDFSLARNWLRREPVFAFEDLPVPFERYGRCVQGNLYKVGLWRDRRIELRREKSASGASLLVLDLRRPWDYPGRTVLEGRVRPDGEPLALTNGVQFVELPARTADGPFRFVIESDQPLPEAPYWKLVELNGDLRLAFGMGADPWAWNLANDAVYPNSAIPSDAAQLYDQGQLHLPTFAGRDHKVFAEFRVEFIQDHPFWQQQHVIEIESGAAYGHWGLPPRRQQKQVALSLGWGSDGFQMRPVSLRTSLPCHQTQNSRDFRLICRQNGFVKLYDVRIFAWAPPKNYPVVANIGVSRDGAVVHEGFFGREHSGQYRGRWSAARGDLRLRLPSSPNPLRMRWRIKPLRPDQDSVRPTFRVNEQVVPAEGIRLEKAGPIWTYIFTVAPEWLEPKEWNMASIEVPTWCPAETLPSQDVRDLGIFVERLIVEEIQVDT